MTERDELIRNLRQLVDLERASGVEFIGKTGPEVRKSGSPEVLRVRDVPPAPVMRPAPVPAVVKTIPPSAVPASAPPDFRTSGLPDFRTSTSDFRTPAPTGLAANDLAAIAAQIAACQRCRLCTTRTSTVPGEGHPSPELLFVGEGPGADEDAQGRPFVGAAGQLLTKMITAMGLRREDVFITNVVKCRPPNNRNPEPDEVAACLPFLDAQIQALRPKLICTLGNVPLRALMGDDTLGITKMRGKTLSWKGIALIPTFHPSYLLRNPTAKKPCWDDLQAVLKALGRTPPPRTAAGS